MSEARSLDQGGTPLELFVVKTYACDLHYDIICLTIPAAQREAREHQKETSECDDAWEYIVVYRLDEATSCFARTNVEIDVETSERKGQAQ